MDNRSCCQLLHPKDMIDVIFSGICKVVNIHGFFFNPVYAHILRHKQRPEAVFAHKCILPQNAQLRELTQLFYRIQNLFRKGPGIFGADCISVIQQIVPEFAACLG